MGRRGPPPRPTAIRLIRGNPGKHKVPSKAPPPNTGVPHRPDWLPGEAEAVWRRLSKQLKVMGVLTLAEADAMAGYCMTYVQWKRATEFLEKHGFTYPLRDEKGRLKYLVPFPEVAIARNALLMLKAYQQEFGLTPAARTRIEINWEGGETNVDHLARQLIGY